MRYRALRASILLIAAPVLAGAQPAQQALTLPECIRLAESVPSAVSLARQERDIAARDLTQARSDAAGRRSASCRSTGSRSMRLSSA